jgi:hypothetical protein
MQIPIVFDLATQLAIKHSTILPLKDLDGCWEHKFEHDGRTWWLAINGDKEPRHSEPPECMGVDVPGYSVALWCNGWLAGVVDAGGGALLGAGEADVVQALEAALGVTHAT